MKKLIPAALTICLCFSGCGVTSTQASPDKRTTKTIPNRLIDFSGFERIVNQSGKLREQRRLTEAAFLRMMSEKNVVILDARTDKRYDMLHIRGAVNLPFTEFTARTLAKIIPSKRTKVLIYCNNNFLGNQTAFPYKYTSASLNLSTFTSLMSYGYKNIYELGPLLDVRTTRLPFDGEHSALQKLFVASADWRRQMADRAILYKYVRTMDGPTSSLAVFKETIDTSIGRPLGEQVRSRAYGDMGLLIEDSGTPGKYTMAVTGKDLQGYLHPKKAIAGPGNRPQNHSVTIPANSAG